MPAAVAVTANVPLVPLAEFVQPQSVLRATVVEEAFEIYTEPFGALPVRLGAFTVA